MALVIGMNVLMLLFLLIFLVGSMSIKESLSEFDCKQSSWLHVPKTASSFCLTLQHVCCEEEFTKATQSVTEAQLELYHAAQQTSGLKSNLNFTFDVAYGCAYFKHFQDGSTGCRRQPKSKENHSPLPLTINLESISVIAMFREPKSRILSSFLDSRHHEGMSEVDYKALQKEMEEAPGRAGDTERLLNQLSLYASHPHMMGCQVKMVMGYECSAPLNLSFSLNRSFVDHAVDRMKQFFFVGLTDYYNVSVDLFLIVASHNTHASVVEKMPVRVSRSQKEEALLYQVFHYHDPIDDYFYQKAKERFFSDVKTHKVEVHGRPHSP